MNYSEMGENDNYMGVFDMDSSRYSDYLDRDYKYGAAGIDDPKTLLRNKRAFFRRQGILIKEKDI